ncbi:MULTISPECIES: AAA family ATPase [unclassified Candidatus Frackibacter]|uniref:AAA family ATPase n=1 Tax=unclassified Candidatus Frackibacter TaxID=2648818 RepID=UPI00088EC8C9|nr:MULTISPECIES: AAA family ATPase [unclassified Candidatus Frackibacter]SDC50789.1 exonuclease SbcC [Candidatus Frackibacter sp. WG11]SEM40520.1 exonuclease SbcC [Candidatus Frackibacter sp. WG12]SFL74926.1 exonuclease SbcC [Candidatus Frackibacter sp. WG13]
MQIIKEITIENFQSHNQTIIELSDGLNVITGPSDTGKSAIIRALRWVLYNEPLGDEFIQVGTNQCRVGILLANGYRVIRERSNRENRYVVIDPTGEKEIYSGFGTKVPKDVTEVHQMPKVTIDDDMETTLNLDYQLVGPFLLNDSGSTKAKVIGQLTGVHIIDAAIKDVAIDLTRAKRKKKQELSEIERIDEQLKEYQDLPALKKEINKKEKLLGQLKEVNNRLNKYYNLQRGWEEVEKERVYLKEVLKELNQLEKMERLLKKMSKKKEKLLILKRLWNDWQKTNANIEKLDQTLNRLSNLDKVGSYYQKIDSVAERRKTLNKLKQSFNEVKEEIITTQSKLKETTNLDKIEKSLSEFSKYNKKYLQLKNIQQEWKVLITELNEKEKVLKKLNNTDRVQNLIQQMKQIKDRLRDLKQIKEDYMANKQSINKGREYIETVKRDLNKNLNRYENKLKELKRCPLCFSQIEEGVLERIIDNYQLGRGK